MKDEGTAAAPDLKICTKGFAICVIRMFSSLPKTIEAQALGRQVLRSDISIGGAHLNM
jgi:hypothetical protein